jgi:2-methylcitrate dehydratase
MDAITNNLATYATSLEYNTLPDEAIYECKRRVIDSLGIALGGYREAPCEIARALARTTTGQPGATILGTTHKATPEMAAFANGTMVHSQDYMDTYLSKEACHPSDIIAPVVAIAEDIGANGKAIVRSIVLAYEVMCRLCDAAGIRERGWDHVTYGAIASAMAVGRVLGLDVRRMREAISLAAVANIALRQTRVGEIPMWKACAPANAGRNGLFAARLAALGLTGPAEAFQGPKGFERQVSGSLTLVPFGTVGDRLMINRTHIKFWPVQYNTQSGIQAALDLRRDIDDVNAIASMTIDIADVGRDLAADTPAKWDPRTRETADHSLPYIVVAALLDGDISGATFDMERIRDPRRLDLVKRVEVRVDPEFSRQYPNTLSVRLCLAMKDGRRLSRKVDHPRGHCENPLTDGEVEAKFRRLASTAVSPRQIDAILDRLWKLESLDDIGPVLKLFAV